MYTFNETVRGYRHIQEGLPCQDRSLSYTDMEKGYHVIAVADGHGDPACARSGEGSLFAARAAKECLVSFADAVSAGSIRLDSPRERGGSIRQLAGTVIAKWRRMVRGSLERNGPTEDEKACRDGYGERYAKGEVLEHLYGTTLIAGLHTGDWLILIQQGDGRCDVFYGDGSVSQPIPWDDRCEGAVTTSMCDADAPARIRTAAINLHEQDVIACFMGSDGVEDSYYGNGKTQHGTHRFYMELMCRLHEYGPDGFEEYLSGFLPGFSAGGSMDDVSVAGIVDMEKTMPFLDEFREKVDAYDHHAMLLESLTSAEAKAVSMERKHGTLKKMVEEALEHHNEAADECNRLSERLMALEGMHAGLEEEHQQAIQALESCRKEGEQALSNATEAGMPLSARIKLISEEVREWEDACDETGRQLAAIEIEISEKEVEKDLLAGKLAVLEKEMAEAAKVFEEYDGKYMAVLDEAETYRKELEEMESKGKGVT